MKDEEDDVKDEENDVKDEEEDVKDEEEDVKDVNQIYIISVQIKCILRLCVFIHSVSQVYPCVTPSTV